MNERKFKNIKEDIKQIIEEQFNEEHFDLLVTANKMLKTQKEKLVELAEHYYDTDDMHLNIDKRFAYYQIIEDCFKILKETDETLKNKSKMMWGGDNNE